jgi:two-component system OmpR family response regulator
MHILLIEDDIQSARYLLKALKETGHSVDYAEDGEEGLQLALTRSYDVMIVDRMLPGRGGLTVIKMLRADGNHTPALVLSGLGEVDDRVTGLRVGGDDYLVKPYALSELLARLAALVRRGQPREANTRLQAMDLMMDLRAHRVMRSGRLIRLQAREYHLLEYLMRHQGQVVTRAMLLEQVWDYHFDPQTNVVDVHISRLRTKIDRGFDKPLLHTIRGVGYKLGEAP